MRYLVNWKMTPVPRENAKTVLALLEALERWIEEEKKAGRLVEIWTNTAGREGIQIWEVNSNDALFEKLFESPYPFFTCTVTPLTDFKLSVKMFKEQLKKIAGD